MVKKTHLKHKGHTKGQSFPSDRSIHTLHRFIIIFLKKVCTLHKTVQICYSLPVPHQSVNTARDLCPKTGSRAAQLSGERVPQLMSLGPGTASLQFHFRTQLLLSLLTKIKCGTEPTSQAKISCLFLSQVQLKEGIHFFIFMSASMAQRRPLVPPS